MSFVERADTKLRAGSERENLREKGKLNPGAEDLTVQESLLFACFRTYSLPGAFLGNPREFDSPRGSPSFLNRTGNRPGPFPDAACGFCSRWPSGKLCNKASFSRRPFCNRNKRGTERASAMVVVN